MKRKKKKKFKIPDWLQGTIIIFMLIGAWCLILYFDSDYHKTKKQIKQYDKFIRLLNTKKVEYKAVSYEADNNNGVRIEVQLKFPQTIAIDGNIVKEFIIKIWANSYSSNATVYCYDLKDNYEWYYLDKDFFNKVENWKQLKEEEEIHNRVVKAFKKYLRKKSK